jgi:hypothetical protein
MAEGMPKNSGTALTGTVRGARLGVVGDGPGGVFREELARPVVTGRFRAHPPGAEVSLAAQVGVRQLRVDAAVVYVLAAVGPFAHDVFWDVRHGNSSVERGKDVKACGAGPLAFLRFWVMFVALVVVATLVPSRGGEWRRWRREGRGKQPS